jgi:hypothetical protein
MGQVGEVCAALRTALWLEQKIPSYAVTSQTARLPAQRSAGTRRRIRTVNRAEKARGEWHSSAMPLLASATAN